MYIIYNNLEVKIEKKKRKQGHYKYNIYSYRRNRAM